MKKKKASNVGKHSHYAHRKPLVLFAAALFLLAELTNSAASLAAGTNAEVPEAAAEKIITENELGVVDGLDYELWKDSGTTQMTLKGDGAYECRWEDINNALFRIGRKFDCTQSCEELGDIRVEYGAEYYPVGNSYLCVYGWTREPLVEYYVVQSWGNWRPPGAVSLGPITVDDSSYDVYVTTREQQPSIDGTQTFQQFWSVRKGKRSEGTVSLSEHFNAWEELGMDLGKLYEIALTVEGYQSSGFANVYKNEIIIDPLE